MRSFRHERLETLSTNSPVMVFAIDSAGILLEVQGKDVAAMAKSLDRDTIIGLNLLQLVESNAAFTNAIQIALGERRSTKSSPSPTG